MFVAEQGAPGCVFLTAEPAPQVYRVQCTLSLLHINTGLNICSLFRARSGFLGVFCFLSDIVYCLLYSSELHLTVEGTLAIQGFNICGSKDSQESHELHSLWDLYAEACV